ncbi:MAG: efflux RND transporter permease subunit [Peptococcaceae bacterium]|nr:efflux RND transporter permease subunit [Peptococcaceae bacterium]
MKITDFSVERPVTMVMVIIGLLVLGFTALNYLSIDLLPEITNPTLTVSASYPGAGPEEVEKDVARVIEAAVGTISNVEKITSNSQVGSCQVRVQFAWGTDMDTAQADVRARLELYKRRLPDSVENLAVYKFDTSMMPIMSVSVSGPRDKYSLMRMVEDNIQPALERVPGVAGVSVGGGLTREIQVRLDPGRLQQYGLTVTQLIQTLQGENVDVSGGVLPRGRKDFVVRGLGRYNSLDDLKSLPVMLPGGGSIRLGELAEVEDTFAAVSSYALLNDKPAVYISINKQSGSNTVDVANRVKRELEKLKKELPGDLEFATGFDQSKTVEDSINDITRSIILGSGLAILVLLVFLRNLRTTVVIATSIPFAVITAFALMYFNNMTLNMMSMAGLSLGVGHMVDYSIVVLESIYRHRQKGLPVKEAAKEGTREVGMAVTASALTVAVVFLPMVFVRGLAGQLFKQFALTVAFSQLAALFVALTLVPLICSRFLHKTESLGEGKSWWNRAFRKSEDWYAGLDEGYRRLLRWSLDRRLKVVAVAALVTLGSLGLVRFIGTEFMPSQDAGQINVNIEMPVATTLEETGKVAEEIRKRVLQIPEVESVITSVGGGGGPMGSGGGDRAQFNIRLKDDRKRSTDEVMNELRGKTAGIPGATVRISASSGTAMLSRAFTGRAIEITLKGNDLDTLRNLAEEMKKAVEEVPGTHHVGHSMSIGRPELQMRFNRDKLAHYGISSSQLAQVIRVAGEGQVVTTLDQGGTLTDVRLILDPELKKDANAVTSLSFTGQNGARIPIAEVVDMVEGEGPRNVQRADNSRVAYIYGDYSGRDLGSVIAEIEKKLGAIPLPPGYSFVIGGQSQDMAQSFGDLGPALVLAILLVYMVMAGQFESLLYPFAIMFSIPVSVTGVVLSLVLTGRAFSVPAFIGLIMMCGIVVNNAIVLIDYIKQLKSGGLARDEAIVRAGPVRLRPILMTAFTTMFAMLPLALGMGEGTELQAPMATVVIGGLLVSTALTLVVVPVVYTIFDDLGRRAVDLYRAWKLKAGG